MNIRTHQAGDIGWIISQHGLIYTSEFGFDPNFEIHIANKFVNLFGPDCPEFNTIWIMQSNGQRAGSIAVWKKSESIAFINFVILKKEFRGQGFSRSLLDKVIQHCKLHNYKVVELETYSCLASARELYKKYGFVVIQTDENMDVFGQSLNREFWQLTL
ncbi:MAG: GNAT family N-acetyltransferase [Gammaproteobacteria bacterium]|nr:GNAT family N-acetyltransferase [Gammaproteobacteria bacterium]NNC97519.1 GNAT family N-acetyltransferase [Gammaproteobacteria bacterium]